MSRERGDDAPTARSRRAARPSRPARGGLLRSARGRVAAAAVAAALVALTAVAVTRHDAGSPSLATTGTQDLARASAAGSGSPTSTVGDPAATTAASGQSTSTPSGPARSGTGTPSSSPAASGRAAALPAPPAAATTAGSSPTPSPSRTAQPATITTASAGAVPFSTRCAVSPVLVPSCGVYWGIYSRRYGNSVQQSVTTWESQLGRPFDIVMMYYDFAGEQGNWPFPEPGLVALGKNHILLLDWEAKIYLTNTPLRWADVAAGTYDDTEVIPQARRIKAYGGTVMLRIDHEMDLSRADHGTPEEYVAMYRHIRQVFAQEGVHNVVWTWVPTGDVWYENGPLTKRFYPGNTYVDWVGFDPYNYSYCTNQPWHTFSQTLDMFYAWTAANGMGSKPLLVQEYGTVYDESNRPRRTPGTPESRPPSPSTRESRPWSAGTPTPTASCGSTAARAWWTASRPPGSPSRARRLLPTGLDSLLRQQLQRPHRGHPDHRGALLVGRVEVDLRADPPVVVAGRVVEDLSNPPGSVALLGEHVLGDDQQVRAARVRPGAELAVAVGIVLHGVGPGCLLYTSDAADE